MINERGKQALEKTGDNGLDIQRRMAVARGYNHWVFESINPFLGKRLLETGAAIGNMTQLLSPGRELFIAVDCNSKYVEIAKHNWQGPSHVQFLEYDVTDAKIRNLQKFNFDSVVSLNLLEHLEQEEAALNNFNELLSPHGSLVVMVPAFPCIYGEMDRADNHYRRYTKGEIERIMSINGFNIVCSRYFNIFGFFAWFINGRVFKHAIVRADNIFLYETLIPLFKRIEKIRLPLGQSIICVGRKGG